MQNQSIHDANQLITQRFICNYLPPQDGINTWTHEGACITARRVARYGIPADAACWRYLVEHPAQGWSFAVRATWRDGKLMSPLATFTVIESYYPDKVDLVPDEDAVAVAVNDWLQGAL